MPYGTGENPTTTTNAKKYAAPFWAEIKVTSPDGTAGQLDTKPEIINGGIFRFVCEYPKDKNKYKCVLTVSAKFVERSKDEKYELDGGGGTIKIET